ncbi:MAG: glutamate--tRNA ligase [Minisyncoccia bacterium]
MIIMKDAKLIAAKLFPEVKLTIEEIEKKYPPRNLPAGAMVTRLGPSPTGFMHIGHLASALADYRLAKQTNGVFYLRIEDTDQKREIEGASKVIIDSLTRYDLLPDEGETKVGEEIGAYGSYKQSKRLDYYHTYTKWLVENNLAYPCFLTSEELEKIHESQEQAKIRPGYRGEWAIWRDKEDEEILSELDAKTPFVIRFRSNGNFENKIKVTDMIRGERELSENDLDLVLLKSDGYPTYHLAHVIDDHLMKTTHVLRGDEWLSSLPIHLQLFKAFGWSAPEYGHLSPMQKIDEGGSRRKISKRKDPEANVQFYSDAGYPPVAMIEYLLNLYNSNFEDWRKANPTTPNSEFKLDVKKFSLSGALFDENKLLDISKNIIASMEANAVNHSAWRWATMHDPDFAKLLSRDIEYTQAIFGIERGGPTGRKDIGKWSDVKKEVGYFFDELFCLNPEDAKKILGDFDWETVKEAGKKLIEDYNENDIKDVWFDHIKKIADSLGYASSAKEFKNDPSKYKGQVGDVARIYRVLLTGRTISPDLHQVMKVLGKERVVRRLKNFF